MSPPLASVFLACKGVASADDTDCGAVTDEGALTSFELNCETANWATNNNKVCQVLGTQRSGAHGILQLERCGLRRPSTGTEQYPTGAALLVSVRANLSQTKSL